MKHCNKIITLFLALAIAFVCCVPAIVTPAHAVSFDQVASDTFITLNNGDVLRVPAEAITGNYIIYRVNNGAYRYYVIDVFESTEGVKEMAFLSFTRYVGQSAITNASALTPNVWTIYGMKNVLYAISGALTVRPMYSTFDYYDMLGFLLIGGVGTDHTEDEFAGTFEVSTPDYTFTLSREIMGEQFMIVNDPDSQTLDTIQVVVFPDYEAGSVYEGAFANYDSWFISDVSVRLAYNGLTYDLPSDFVSADYSHKYVLSNSKGTELVYVATQYAAFCNSNYSFNKGSSNRAVRYYYFASEGSWRAQESISAGGTCRFDSSSYSVIWSNAYLYDNMTGSLAWSPYDSCISSVTKDWSFTPFLNVGLSFVQDGWDILYSTFDYYDANGNLLYGNSFAGEVTEDDSLIDLTLDDGTVIRVPERFGERDSYFVVMDPVGGTEETAYLIYEFDYYEGVADGTVCDFIRWYGVATTEQVEVSVTSWEWNYQDYYVTELDILDYGPIVYSTFEYVDGRIEEEEPSGGGATSEEVKGFWDKLFAKLEEILKAIKGIGGTDLSISIENNTIIDETDKEPFAESDYKGIVKILRRSVGFISGFFSDFIMGGVTGFFDMFDNTSSDFYGFFGLGE